MKTIVLDDLKRELYEEIKLSEKKLSWTVINNKLEAEHVIKKLFGENKYFTYDLIEKQKPNYRKEDGYDIVIMSFPDTNVFNQVTFLVSDDRVITITTKDNHTIDALFTAFADKRMHAKNATSLFAEIVEALFEKSSQYLDMINSKVEYGEKQLKSARKNGLFISEAKNMKENLFLASNMLRGDSQAINEVLEDTKSNIKTNYITKHVEARILYMIDYAEFLEQSVDNSINMYLALLSTDLNVNIYRLTVVGALLIIPTIISGFFGMNVNLPALEFWEIVGLTIGLSILSWFVMKK